MNLVCILMAAGAGRRFGSNKLLAPYRGKPLYARALDAVPAEKLRATIVVSGSGEILAEAERRGFFAVKNDRPEEGVSRTIRMGLERARALGADAAMFMVADQPRLTRESVLALVDAFEKDPHVIRALGNGQRRGNPAIFPGRFFDELCALAGDSGGSEVIRRHEDALALHQVADPGELADVDGAEELKQLIIDN